MKERKKEPERLFLDVSGYFAERFNSVLLRFLLGFSL